MPNITHLNKYISTKEAAKVIGYTSDYIGKLARENKIDATRKNGQWAVDLESLKLFVLEAAAQKRERQEQLKKERVQELAKKSAADVLTKIENKPNANLSALIFSFVISTMILVSVGVGHNLYKQGLQNEALLGNIFGMSQWFNNWFSHTDIVMGKEDLAPTNGPITSGIVLQDEAFTESELTQIRNSFSDEVAITPTSSSTGLITPVFKNSTSTESYHYVLVPVEKHLTP